MKRTDVFSSWKIRHRVLLVSGFYFVKFPSVLRETPSGYPFMTFLLLSFIYCRITCIRHTELKLMQSDKMANVERFGCLACVLH